MRQSGVTFLAAAAALAFTMSVSAQKTTPVHAGKGGSPHVKTAWVIDGANITIEYGRPLLKGRTDAAVMPPGQPWRTGADEATVITTDKALKFGTYSLPAGTYTINTQPGEKWELIFGKLEKPGQWGIGYRKDLELARTPMTAGKTKAPVESLTISIDDTPAGATLRIEWGSTSASAPFTVG
jgi:hypothetical protein